MIAQPLNGRYRSTTQATAESHSGIYSNDVFRGVRWLPVGAAPGPAARNRSKKRHPKPPRPISKCASRTSRSRHRSEQQSVPRQSNIPPTRYRICLTDSRTGSCRRHSRRAKRPGNRLDRRIPRGYPVVICIAPDGLIRRVHPPHRSWHNGPAIAHSGQNDRGPDIPLRNKSFSLRYSGHNLCPAHSSARLGRPPSDRISSGAALAMARGLRSET